MDAGVGVVATPTPLVATRIVELFGVLCSGEWGGELKLPGEESASAVFMAAEHGSGAAPNRYGRAWWTRIAETAKVGQRLEKKSRRRMLLRALQFARLNAQTRVGRMGGLARLNTTTRVLRTTTNAVENTKVDVHAGGRPTENAKRDICTGDEHVDISLVRFRWPRQWEMRYR